MDVSFQRTDVNFLAGLRKQVNGYFKERNISQAGDSRLIWKSLIILSVFCVLYYLPLGGFDFPVWGLALIYGIQGIMLSLIGFNIMHDGSHDSFSEKSSINRLAALSLNFLGGNALFWKQKHCQNHHTYTNIEMLDDDIDLKPFLRLHDGQKSFGFHRFQHFYALPLYGLTYIFWIHYRDYKKYFSGKIAEETVMPPLTRNEHWTFWFSKLLHLTVFIAIPVALIGWKVAIGGYLLMGVLCGFSLGVVFQLAHIVEGTTFQSPSDLGKVNIESEWAVYQIKTTVNFATKSRIATWFLGGLNFQMVHHLFPRISHVHYPEVHRIILEYCKKNGVEVLEFPTFMQAMRSHLKQLKMMGNMQAA
jgi:linoleoyl-CoA desaturase